MDFIERILGISPDAGSGSFEFLIIALPVAFLAALVARARQRASG